jgi:hypothetical protein
MSRRQRQQLDERGPLAQRPGRVRDDARADPDAEAPEQLDGQACLRPGGGRGPCSEPTWLDMILPRHTTPVTS